PGGRAFHRNPPAVPVDGPALGPRPARVAAMTRSAHADTHPPNGRCLRPPEYGPRPFAEGYRETGLHRTSSPGLSVPALGSPGRGGARPVLERRSGGAKRR